MITISHLILLSNPSLEIFHYHHLEIIIHGKFVCKRGWNILTITLTLRETLSLLSAMCYIFAILLELWWMVTKYWNSETDKHLDWQIMCLPFQVHMSNHLEMLLWTPENCFLQFGANLDKLWCKKLLRSLFI